MAPTTGIGGPPWMPVSCTTAWPLPRAISQRLSRHGHDARHREREREAAPEQQAVEALVHGARDQQHDRVVDDLHHGDAERVRGERDRHDGREREAGAQQRQAGEQVAEEERERDRQRDRRPVAPAQRGADDHAQDLADRAAGQAVQGGGDGDAGEVVVVVHRDVTSHLPPGQESPCPPSPAASAAAPAATSTPPACRPASTWSTTSPCCPPARRRAPRSSSGA